MDLDLYLCGQPVCVVWTSREGDKSSWDAIQMTGEEMAASVGAKLN